jgi:hypothetical protein
MHGLGDGGQVGHFFLLQKKSDSGLGVKPQIYKIKKGDQMVPLSANSH